MTRSDHADDLDHRRGVQMLEQARTQQGDRRVIFYCHSGQRSQLAAQAFASNGHQNVFNLMGGIDAWSTEIDPQVPRY